MDKGKSTAATSSEAMWVSAKELFGIESSDSDEDRRSATSSKGPAPASGVDEGASSSATGAVGASSSSAPAQTQDVAPFEDGQYVRLRNRGRGGYLFANEDGRGVSIDHRRHMVNTAWAVQVLSARVLLRGAYGRYLSATRSAARSGHIGGYVAQCILEFPDDHHIEWSVTRGKRGSVVLLRATDGGPCKLRANGRYLRWNKGVTYGGGGLHIAMVAWVVAVSRVDTDGPPEEEADGHLEAQPPWNSSTPPPPRSTATHPGATPYGRTPDGASPTASGISDGASDVKDLDLPVDGV
ncbi:unnamed protein product [Miscanthus lutarioriparius]|uniref:DUF569 domain-containing protein n=1 Tax=Miscanthus lutarioriparius TaxID=422564 RepID=A0A811MLJ8_9POAL|nr:unnamed protein product [Miscanthus lutarioriparius]